MNKILDGKTTWPSPNVSGYCQSMLVWRRLIACHEIGALEKAADSWWSRLAEKRIVISSGHSWNTFIVFFDCRWGILGAKVEKRWEVGGFWSLELRTSQVVQVCFIHSGFFMQSFSTPAVFHVGGWFDRDRVSFRALDAGTPYIMSALTRRVELTLWELDRIITKTPLDSSALPTTRVGKPGSVIAFYFW